MNSWEDLVKKFHVKIEKVEDASGHEHDDLGQFTGSGGDSKENAREQIHRDYTDPKTGALDHDSIVSAKRRRGLLPPASTTAREAVFLLGAGGSGKGGIADSYVGNLGRQSHLHPRFSVEPQRGGSFSVKDWSTGKTNNALFKTEAEANEFTHQMNAKYPDKIRTMITQGHPQYQEPRAGHDPARSRYYNSDDEKRRIATYSDKVGDPEAVTKFGAADLGGPSGPQSAGEFARYPQAVQAAVNDYVRRNTGHVSAEDFARNTTARWGPERGGDANKGVQQGDWRMPGGLTHELSSRVVKQRLAEQLNDPTGRSFVYDSTGANPQIVEMMQRALDNGYHVLAHHADADTIFRQKMNALRPRSVDPAIIEQQEGWVNANLPAIHHFVDRAKGAGRPADFINERTHTDADLQDAINEGWTRYGKPEKLPEIAGAVPK